MSNGNTIKIFLGNLNSDTSSDKIRPLFEKYGEVVECDVLKNFGFVHMVNKNEANKAIAQLDGYSVDGNNIRVELSTGKKGGGGGGKFDKKGFNGGGRGRPYGPPPGRGGPGPRGGDFDRYPYPPPPPMPYDRYDPYYRYYMEREAYYARLGGPLPDRMGGAGRDRYPPVPGRDRMDDRFPDPRDRLPPPRGMMDERSRGGMSDPYFRERDPLGSRPPPEYYDRKMPLGSGRGADSGAAAAGAGRGSNFNGVGNGDYYGRNAMDRPGASMGGAAGAGGDFFRQGSGAGGTQGGYGRPPAGGMGGPGGKPDSQSSFATDPIFF